MYIITRDGSGDHTSIRQAVDAIPAGNAAPVLLLVRMNEYRETVTIDKDHVRLIGEARDRTVVSSDEGEALTISGRNVTVENLTVRSGGETRVYDAPRPAAPTVFLCGDGTALPLVEALAPCVTLESCITSGGCKAFVTEKRLGFVELCLRPGDWLLIRFDFAHADALTPLYLNMYIDAARGQGAEPVLLADPGSAPMLRALALERDVRLLDAPDPAALVRAVLRLLTPTEKETSV